MARRSSADRAPHGGVQGRDIADFATCRGRAGTWDGIVAGECRRIGARSAITGWPKGLLNGRSSTRATRAPTCRMLSQAVLGPSELAGWRRIRLGDWRTCPRPARERFVVKPCAAASLQLERHDAEGGWTGTTGQACLTNGPTASERHPRVVDNGAVRSSRNGVLSVTGDLRGPRDGLARDARRALEARLVAGALLPCPISPPRGAPERHVPGLHFDSLASPVHLGTAPSTSRRRPQWRGYAHHARGPCRWDPRLRLTSTGLGGEPPVPLDTRPPGPARGRSERGPAQRVSRNAARLYVRRARTALT